MALFIIFCGVILELVGAILMTYFIAQGWEEWPIALLGLGICVAGLIILYASFKPIIM